MGDKNKIFQVWQQLQVLLENSPFECFDAQVAQGQDGFSIVLQLGIDNKQLQLAGPALQQIAEKSGMVAEVDKTFDTVDAAMEQHAKEILRKMQNGKQEEEKFSQELGSGLIDEMLEEVGATELTVELSPVSVDKPAPVVRKKVPQKQEVEEKQTPKPVQAERRTGPTVLDASKIAEMFNIGE